MADDMLHMQREAARRVQRMQEHSRRVFETYQGHPPQGTSIPWQEELRSPGLYARPAEDSQMDRPETHTPTERTQAQAPGAVNLSLPRLETEQWLLLGLAVLLFRCGCRTELLLALLYLAM